MDYIKETFHFKEEAPIILFETNARQMYMHSHNCLEINLILAGSGYYVIEEKRYDITAGDIFVINNQERHMAVHNGDLKILVLIFEPGLVWEGKQESSLLEPFFNRSPLFSNRIRDNESVYPSLKIDMDIISREYLLQKNGWTVYVKAQLLLFLVELFRYCQEKQELGGDIKNLHKMYSKIRPVLDYIHEHFTEQLTLEDLAEHAIMNKSYLCTCFKETMNLRIFEYIDQLRINKACVLLKTTEESITEIALEVGYSSVSYFNRNFKHVKSITPRNYREDKIN